jgi:acetyl-CoA acetyltransferase
MKARVAIARCHALQPGNFWKASVGDLIIEAVTPVIDGSAIDAVFAAAASPLDRQANIAALVCDRLGLSPRAALSFDAGDVSGAAALSAAYVHVASGAAENALVVAAAKVSDWSEAEKLSCLDRLLDQEADVARGLDFATQAGLLAQHYCGVKELDTHIFTDTTALNLAAWSKHVERPAVTRQELRRDLIAAAPLVRSDFANIVDGACAMILRRARDDDSLVIERMASATDILSVWDRPNPLVLSAVERALATLGPLGPCPPRWWEIDAAVSVAEHLTRDALSHALDGEMAAEPVVNLRGGAAGRGRVFGASPLYQLTDISEAKAPHPTVLALAVGGLGSQVFATYLSVRGGA